MSIRPVDFGGMIQRTDDVGILKHQQDQKPHVDQQNIQIHVQQEQKRKTQQVLHADDSKMGHDGFDAKEKGKNQYYGRDGKKKKQDPEVEEDFFVVKNMTGGFDIKI